MAIQVSGTQVIGNSRELTNIASVDATTATAIGNAGVGGDQLFPSWNPASTPNETLTGSGTWTKPSRAATDWVVFFMVGGGCGGTKSYGGSRNAGGNAQIVYGTIADLPSSLTYSVGAGGAANQNGDGFAGNDTTLTGNGRTFTAEKGAASDSNPNQTNEPNPFRTNQFGTGVQKITNNETGIQGGKPVNPSTYSNYLTNAVFGGGGGGVGTGQGINNYPGGVSLYSGNGGAGSYTGSGGYGTVPGGAGGSTYYNAGTARDGAAGNIRVYYITP